MGSAKRDGLHSTPYAGGTFVLFFSVVLDNKPTTNVHLLQGRREESTGRCRAASCFLLCTFFVGGGGVFVLREERGGERDGVAIPWGGS